MDAIVASFGLEEGLLRGFVFGLVHVGILIIGYYSGWSINRLLKRTSNGHIAGIVGAVIAHILADLIASLLDPTMRSAALGIVLGGIVPLLFIPILEKYVTKSDAHIMVGDHEDIENDLKSITTIPIHKVDERMTSKLTNDKTIRNDDLAALEILNSHLKND